MATVFTDADIDALTAGGAGGTPPGAAGGTRATLTDADIDALSGGAKAPADQSYVKGLLRSLIGQGALMGWGDEVMGRLRQLAGEDYETARDDERAKVAAFRKENPKTALGAELAGGFLTPGLGLLGGVMKPAATGLGKVWQGAKIGAGAGALSSMGATEGDMIEAAKHGAALGAPLGAVAGGLGHIISGTANKTADAVAPTLARAGAKLTRTDPGEAAADSVLKSWMRASGDTPESLRKFFDDAERAGRFYSNSSVNLPVMLADASPGMQKFAGTVVRSNPEAAKVGETVLRARQTGVTPKEGAALAERAGLVVRNPLSEVAADAAPAGSVERLARALKKSFLIDDAPFHGHEANAYLTEKSLTQALRDKSKQLFPDAYHPSNARPFDLAPAFTKLQEIMQDRAGNHLAVLQRAGKLFLDPRTGQPLSAADQLKRAQSAKEMLDDIIEPLIRAGKGKLVGDLTEFRRAVTSQLKATNPKYGEALDFYSSQMDLKNALELGRKALREDSNVVADQFREMTTGERKLALLGIVDDMERMAKSKPRTSDATRVLETPRVQEILREVIPRSNKKSGVFADRPERFGDFVGIEKTMAATNQKVFGNSMTAERLADDARFTRQTIGEMFDRYRSSPSLFAIGMEAISAGLNKVFGFRDDVAKELARRLFMADPAQREAILQRLEAQWGSDKLGKLVTLIAGSGEAAAVALPSATGRAIGESRK